MSYCGPRGIPHSHFLGGPLVWTKDDRDKALAWADRQARTHDKCGTRPEEWDPEQGGDLRAYEYFVDGCPGCEKAERTEQQVSQQRAEGALGVRLNMRRPVRNTTPRGGA